MNRTTRPNPWLTTRKILVVGVATAGLALTGCSTGPLSTSTPGADNPAQTQQPGGADSSAPASTPTPAPAPDPVTITANPENGSKSVKVDTAVSVKASNGTLSKVAVSAPVKDRDGKVSDIPVSGALNKAKTEWKASDRLEPGVTYTVTSTGKNPEGTSTKTTSTFATQALTLAEQTFATVSPLSGTYGVAMPIVVTFDVAVTDRKAFEKNLNVSVSPAQAGTWSWYSSTEVHYRPKAYWKAGTKIKLDVDVNGLAAGKGVYGQSSRSAEYTIGRSVITTVDLATRRASVKINGETARSFGISAGKPGFTTRSGTKVISQKLAETRMASETIGINKNSSESYDLKVKYAMRITNTGEFLHAAPWNAGNMGVRNASHGCVGMNTADAAWLFNTVNIGDPVVTTGSSRGLEKGNGWTDWDVSYAQFSKGSAL